MRNEKASYMTNASFYESLVSFALYNACITYTRMMNQVLQLYVKKSVVSCFGHTFLCNGTEEHIFHLKELLRVLQFNQLYIKFKSCIFEVVNKMIRNWIHCISEDVDITSYQSWK